GRLGAVRARTAARPRLCALHPGSAAFARGGGGSLRAGCAQPVEHQPVEPHGGGLEPPAEVRAALATERDLPGEAGEPAPVCGPFAALDATPGLAEAGDYVLDPGRVDESAGGRAFERGPV